MTALVRWPQYLDDHEAEHDRDGAMPAVAPPPFAHGDRIVDPDRPQLGSMIVSEVWWQGRYYRVRGIGAGGWTGSGPADHFVRCPEGWTEPPALPMSAVTLLECSTDGAISREDYADAHQQDAAPSRERAEAYLAMAEWWSWVAAKVAPEMAAREAAGFRRMAGRTA